MPRAGLEPEMPFRRVAITLQLSWIQVSEAWIQFFFALPVIMKLYGNRRRPVCGRDA